MRLKRVAATCLVCCGLVSADTEIRNVKLPFPKVSGFAEPVPNGRRLDKSIHQLELTVSHQQPDITVALDFDDAYDDWTVRISWPGSSPTAFDLDIRPTENRQADLSIRSKALTPRMTHPQLPNIPSFLPFLSTPKDIVGPKPTWSYNTTLHLVLEPLKLGVIPETAVPVIYYVLGTALPGALLAPLIIWYFEMKGGIPELIVVQPDKRS